MKSNLYLLQFNNYYNRQVKRYDTLSSYSPYYCEGFLSQNPIPDVNFIPNDGIQTTQIINWDGQNPDYLLVCEDNTIISRWFVIDAVRMLNGQYKLTLYRDTIADYYDQLIKAPMFVEKGYVSTSDSAIYNSENMSFNQIKTQESLLKDPTQSAWIVGYCAKPTGDSGETIKYGGIPSVSFEVAELDDWQYANLINENTNLIDANSFKVGFLTELDDAQGNTSYSWVDFDTENTYGLTNVPKDNIGIYTGITASAYDTAALGWYRANESTINAAKIQSGYVDPGYRVGNITRLNNQRIKVGTGDTTQYYKISVEHNKTSEILTYNNTTNAGREMQNIIEDGIRLSNDYISYPATFVTKDEARYRMQYNVDVIKITLTPYSFSEGFTGTLRYDRPQLVDAPYCMFCIPYSDNYKIKKSASTTVNTNTLNSLSFAVGIATSLGGTGTTSLYDLQLLPYCPVPLVREYGETIDLTDTDLTDNIVYDFYDDSNTIIFWAKDSSGSFNITYNYYTNTDPIRFKVKEQTTMWRLCSPNYNGVFEFNPYKNSGTNYINVDYTYKPHQPYIHLNPNFKALYGQDFNDARGLICGGDFSLPIIDDAWTDYEIQNKNYQNIFNRQIQNMETQYEVAREQEAWNIGTSAVSGGLAGATAGMYIGGPVGAITGGLIGGTASLLAGQKDRELNELLRQEALDYTKDMFGYQVGNIKALPDALTRVSAYNYNNKIFPFIERYSATPEEEEALKNKLIYNGMSIYRIGTLEEFIINKPITIDFGYYKGKIIRLEDIGDDFHIANTIATEMNKGVYII